MRQAMGSPLILFVSLIMLTAGAEDKLPSDDNRKIYCETCLATVKELKKAVKVLGGELSQAKMKAEMRKVCKGLKSEENSLEESRAACKHLLDVYEDKFEDAFLTEEEAALEANLCYIHTRACTGVKRKSFQDEKQIYEDGVIEEVLKKHKDRVRHAKPTAADGAEILQNTKQEL